MNHIVFYLDFYILYLKRSVRKEKALPDVDANIKRLYGQRYGQYVEIQPIQDEEESRPNDMGDEEEESDSDSSDSEDDNDQSNKRK